MSKEELAENGANASITHNDFMIDQLSLILTVLLLMADMSLSSVKVTGRFKFITIKKHIG